VKLCVVTATTNLRRAQACVESWGDVPTIIVLNGVGERVGPLPAEPAWFNLIETPHYLGTVPAFNLGVQDALKEGFEIIACFHDDLELQDPDWATKVETHFKRHPACGLAGFGGAIGLGDPQIYQTPYDPMQLARVGFRSNMPEAEIHGIRSLLPEQVACLDGFSQIGRAEFFKGDHLRGTFINPLTERKPPPWQALEDLGIIHHFYDGALGCLAARYGWETWYLPIKCVHYGGRTAVGDQGYQHWAANTIPGGDHGFWEQAHRHGYREFRDVLPLRV
jgi:hypothetical protein